MEGRWPWEPPARTEKAIVLSSPRAYGDWQGTCCLPELNVQGSHEKTQGWDTPLASSPQPSRCWRFNVGRRCRKSPQEGSGETVSTLWATWHSSLSPLNYVSCFLAPTKAFCGLLWKPPTSNVESLTIFTDKVSLHSLSFGTRINDYVSCLVPRSCYPSPHPGCTKQYFAVCGKRD